MLFIWNFRLYQTIILIEQLSIVTMLAITVLIFLVLLILGVRKSYILKKENDRLSQTSPMENESSNKPYRDFTEGHMYNNK